MPSQSAQRNQTAHQLESGSRVMLSRRSMSFSEPFPPGCESGKAVRLKVLDEGQLLLWRQVLSVFMSLISVSGDDRHIRDSEAPPDGCRTRAIEPESFWIDDVGAAVENRRTAIKTPGPVDQSIDDGFQRIQC